MDITLGFHGAAKNVTGSRYLVTAGDFRILVDCGLYQERDFKARNWEDFLVAPASLDAVILTHAHVDHCGLLPKLVKKGFRGPVYGTPATADIAKIILMDSARLQAEDAAYKKRRHEKEGRQGPYAYDPLYTEEDSEAALKLMTPIRYGKDVALRNDIRLSFHEAGHILGSGMVRLELPGKAGRDILFFSGDVGRWNTPILRDPSPLVAADYMVVESTYGNRVHEDNADIPNRLAEVIHRTHRAGGNVVIPSFAVERTQELLFHLGGLLKEGRIPPLPVFVDSPMATRVTEVFRRHPELFDEESLMLIKEGRHPCDFPKLSLCRSVEESKAINERKDASIIIAGSGMCTGGRIKHHLKHNISRPECTILFVGYQAVGTLGRLILDGVEDVRILGRSYPVRAAVERVHGFSAHADRNELRQWLAGLKTPPKHVFVTHGEPEAAESFGALIREELGWPVTVPDYKDTAVLG